MKCTNKLLVLIVTLMAFTLSACKSANIWMPFSEYSKDFHNTVGRTSIIEHSSYDNRIDGFSTDLCVFSNDVTVPNFSAQDAEVALLINIQTNEVIYSKNSFEKKYPASITKLMTAIVAIENSTLDEVITVTEAVNEITEPGAVLLGINPGDMMTMDQALRLMLLSSYNDVAVAIAVHIGGSVEGFSELMNEKALELGATHSHFTNPSGLNVDSSHYTTGYDLYLILNEVIKNSTLLEIIQSTDYNTVITDKNKNERSVGAQNTNRYFYGTYSLPENLNLVGGKTGTTDEAGHCLLMMVRDVNSTPYIALILNAGSTDDLYNQMTEMLSQITN